MQQSTEIFVWIGLLGVEVTSIVQRPWVNWEWFSCPWVSNGPMKAALGCPTCAVHSCSPPHCSRYTPLIYSYNKHNKITPGCPWHQGSKRKHREYIPSWILESNHKWDPNATHITWTLTQERLIPTFLPWSPLLSHLEYLLLFSANPCPASDRKSRHKPGVCFPLYPHYCAWYSRYCSLPTWIHCRLLHGQQIPILFPHPLFSLGPSSWERWRYLYPPSPGGWDMHFDWSMMIPFFFHHWVRKGHVT